MASYTSAADALAGAVAMQVAVERRNRRGDHRSLAMRIGVSAGDATFEDDDWFGTPVIEAARLCAAAEGGQILVSDLVRALAGSRSGPEVVTLGTRALKGLPEPLAVCEVAWVPEAPSDVVTVPAARVRGDGTDVRLRRAGRRAGRAGRRPGRRRPRVSAGWCSSPASPGWARPGW